ncbi:MAG: aldose 1-epimerase [Burkholderiaceae bacterium]
MDLLTLRRGALRCHIAPALGGAIAGLWYDDIAVLRPPPRAGLFHVRESGSYPLLPFSNRIGQARMAWEGTRHDLAPNFSPEPHAIHGVGWQRPWDVAALQADLAHLTLRHAGDSGWPFAFGATQTLRLDTDALELDLVLTNRARHAVPVGLGWHPYFAKRPESHIGFFAAGRWEMGPDKLPTERAPVSGMAVGCAALDVDHCFDGWGGSVHLHDVFLHTTLSSDLGYLVVFTHPSRDFIAIEPVSHVNNALNLAPMLGCDVHALGVQVLQAGQSMTAHMRIAVQPA